MKIFSNDGIVNKCFQFAENGVWETALIGDEISYVELKTWLQNSREDVAIEVVYKNKRNELIGFIGFRRIIHLASEREKFWLKTNRKSLSWKSTTPEQTLRSWFEKTDPFYLMKNKLPSVVLGIFNQWKTAGIINLQDNNHPLYKTNYPDWFYQGSQSPICLEYSWMTEFGEFWAADVVSQLSGKQYFLSVEARDTIENEGFYG